MRLLVIEDEPDIASALEKGLRQVGYAVDMALDGERGSELALVNDYDLLILDLNLPGMDGLEVCQRLRAECPSLLILMLTARSRPDERVAGLDLGADDYLVKPFHFAELTARVRALLRRDLRVRVPLLQYKDLKVDPAARVVWQGNRRIELTSKEFGILEYLLRHQGEIVSQEALLEHVTQERALTRLERLVADLLILATSEQPLARGEVTLGTLLEEVILDLKPVADVQRVICRLNNEVDVVVHGDSSLLTHVFSNLVENGIYYNHPGGEVVVTLDQKDTWAVVTVADTGIGIEAAQLPHIYERFYRADCSHTRHKGGAGLGFSIVSAIVHQHSGKVQVESTPGQGSTFTVLLPP